MDVAVTGSCKDEDQRQERRYLINFGMACCMERHDANSRSTTLTLNISELIGTADPSGLISLAVLQDSI